MYFVLWLSVYPLLTGCFINLPFRLPSQVYMQPHNMENEAKESEGLRSDVSSVSGHVLKVRLSRLHFLRKIVKAELVLLISQHKPQESKGTSVNIV